MNREDYIAKAPTFTIYDGFCKTKSVLENHSRIIVSVSGGSDSDDMVDIVEHLKPDDGCESVYVWFDAGIDFLDVKHWHGSVARVVLNPDGSKVTLVLLKERLEILPVPEDHAGLCLYKRIRAFWKAQLIQSFTAQVNLDRSLLWRGANVVDDALCV